jgi:hypothetical protein
MLTVLTTPSFVFKCFIRSRENVMLDNVIGRYPAPSFPYLIGVRSSSTKVLFKTLHPKSDAVLKSKENN